MSPYVERVAARPGAMVNAEREAIQPPVDAEPIAADDAVKFLTIDILIDPKGQPLAAYQFELTSADASFTVVGVEGGDNAAFDHGRPPYFDPVAEQGKIDRLILADYAKPEVDGAKLPTQSLRVATVHVLFAGLLQEDPLITVSLTTAGNHRGERIEADIRYTVRTPERPEP